ncbi:recombinase family protein [Microbacterium sp. NE2HP2]|uniref:recombinase family protein n=1 Tax=Microbacterium plantarum TaxID=1816425 RepID=UPI0023669ABC|nr:recombinase family protein [Microbacterium plantarum]MDD7943524.1 recombinase family protein [Microbacterium plantarum]
MPKRSAAVATLVDLYLRLSIDKEGEDSLERQEADLRAWAAREGLTVRKVWRDAGVSGYKANIARPDFEKAVAAVLAGEVGTLAVWKLDRLSRRGAGQIGTLLDDFSAVGGRLYFLKDSLDSSGSGHRMVIVMVSEQACAESANTSLRVRSKKDSSRRAGHYLGGPPPFGYDVGADRKLRQNPDKAVLVRVLVDRLLAGESMLAVCRDWNLRGIPTRGRGKEWRSSAVSMTVRSSVLSGLVPEKRRAEDGPGKRATNSTAWRDPETGETVSLMADGEAPILSESERLRLLDTLDSRLRRYGRGLRTVKQPKSLLGGLIMCASCQRSANTFGNSYRCRRVHYDGQDCQRPLVVSVTTIEAAVRHAWAYGLAALEPDSPVLAAETLGEHTVSVSSSEGNGVYLTSREAATIAHLANPRRGSVRTPSAYQTPRQ